MSSKPTDKENADAATKARGRADEGVGRNNPPKAPGGSLLNGEKTMKEASRQKAVYDEGRGDKKREIENEKKK